MSPRVLLVDLLVFHSVVISPSKRPKYPSNINMMANHFVFRGAYWVTLCCCFVRISASSVLRTMIIGAMARPWAFLYSPSCNHEMPLRLFVRISASLVGVSTLGCSPSGVPTRVRFATEPFIMYTFSHCLVTVLGPAFGCH